MPTTPSPTSLVFLLPEAALLPADALARALYEAGLADDAVRGVEHDDETIGAMVAIDLDGLDGHGLIWTEPAQELSRDELEDDDARACRVALRAEAILDRDDPFGGYVALVRLLATAWPMSPMALDVGSGLWLQRAAIDELLLSETVEPPEELLWSVRREQRGSTVWLRTRGLRRCGISELEMLEVPAEHAPAAAELLSTLAGLLLEQPGLLRTGEPLAVGIEQTIILQPVEEAARYLDEQSPGGPGADETGDDDGERGLAVCDPQQHGKLRSVWRWPQSVVTALEQGRATLYRSARTTRRQAGVAQAKWPHLLEAVEALPAERLGDIERPAVLVQAGFAVQAGHPEAGREHLWLAVASADANGAEGLLVHDPRSVAGLRRGQRVKVARADVSDWRVF